MNIVSALLLLLMGGLLAGGGYVAGWHVRGKIGVPVEIKVPSRRMRPGWNPGESLDTSTLAPVSPQDQREERDRRARRGGDH